MDTATLSLIIFIATIVLFIIDKLPMATTAVLGCTVMVLSGVSDFRTAFGQFSSATVILTIGVMIIGESISETGLADLIGNWIVKVSKARKKADCCGVFCVLLHVGIPYQFRCAGYFHAHCYRHRQIQ